MKSTTLCLFLYCVLQVDPGLGRHCASAGWLAGSAARQLDQFPGIFERHYNYLLTYDSYVPL
jgi:hypothetical protein